MLFDLLTSDDWIDFWETLGIRYASFGDVGLDAGATDANIWQASQVLRGTSRLYLP